jgi:hypothetical protein
MALVLPANLETPPSASINRVQIVDLPGLPLDAAVRGKRGDELVSNRVLMALAAERAAALGLDASDLPAVTPQLTRSDVQVRDHAARAIQAALTSDELDRRAAGEAVARRLGRNLGWLLIALQRGDAANQAVRPDWQPADWERWAAVRRVWLGGGLSSGRLGETIAAAARRLLGELDHGQIDVALSPYRGQIALVGAARMFSHARSDRQRRTTQVVGLDFGHTLVKRAVLTYEHGALVGVDLLSPRLTDWRVIYAGQDEVGLGRNVLALLADTIVATAAEAPQAEPVALVSVAAYKERGRLVGNGPYAAIHAAAGDLPADVIVSAAATQCAGTLITAQVIHDGTAAALAHAGSPHSAVIVMGTALGVGFPPVDTTGLCPVAAKLPIAQESGNMPATPRAH